MRTSGDRSGRNRADHHRRQQYACKKGENTSTVQSSPQSELRKAIEKIITAVGLVVYFALSFLTQAWYITWVIFPIMAATQGLVNACMDLKEAKSHEA